MTLSTILVQLDTGAPAAPRLEFALDLARRHESDLIVFAAEEVEVVVPTAEASIVTAELTEQRMQEVEERLKAMKEEVLSITRGAENVTWRSEIGDPTRLLARHARAADLLVTATTLAEGKTDLSGTVDPGSLLLTAGRPVLMASDGLAPLRAERVLIAWSDARESRRAVADALPFLMTASEVLVATIQEGDQTAARASAGDVVRYLMRHGVEARADVIGSAGGDPARTLVDMAFQIGADLVVSGGYGHSRLREWAFGGMTRSLLADGRVNRLVSN